MQLYNLLLQFILIYGYLFLGWQDSLLVVILLTEIALICFYTFSYSFFRNRLPQGILLLGSFGFLFFGLMALASYAYVQNTNPSFPEGLFHQPLSLVFILIQFLSSQLHILKRILAARHNKTESFIRNLYSSKALLPFINIFFLITIASLFGIFFLGITKSIFGIVFALNQTFLILGRPTIARMHPKFKPESVDLVGTFYLFLVIWLAYMFIWIVYRPF